MSTNKNLDRLKKYITEEGLPQAKENEHAILSILINNNRCIEALTEAGITKEHFFSELHRDIYLSCCEVFDTGQNLDGIIVINHLREKGHHSEESIRDVVLNMAEANFLINDIRPHIHSLLRYKQKRDDIVKACALLKKAYSNNGNYEIIPVETGDMNAKSLMLMEFKEVKFVVPSLIPKGLTILGGKPKIGKSLASLNIAIPVSLGGYVFGKIRVEKQGVLYLALEDTQRRLQSRLKTILQNKAPPENLYLMTETKTIENGGIEFLDIWIRNHPEVGLVIVDTLARIKPRAKRNSEIYLEDYEVISRIKKVADDHNIAILIIHHTRKAAADDIFDSISGTTGLTGAADTNIVFKKDRGQADAYMHVVGRDIEEQELALKFDQNTLSWILMGNADEYKLSKDRKDILDLLKDANGAMSTKEIARAIGKAVNSTSNLLSKLLTSRYINQLSHGIYSINNNINDVSSVIE